MLWRMRVWWMLAALVAGASPRLVWASCCVSSPAPMCAMEARAEPVEMHCECCHEPLAPIFGISAALVPAPSSWGLTLVPGWTSEWVEVRPVIWKGEPLWTTTSRALEVALPPPRERFGLSFSCRAPPVLRAG